MSKILNMKKLLLFTLLVTTALCGKSQARLDDSGYYDELVWGGVSKYHLANINALFASVKIDTCGYNPCQFLGNKDIKEFYINHKIRRTYTEMSVDGNQIKSLKTTEHDENHPSDVKKYMLFYMQSKDLQRTTYYFYRYG
jgi:hypothetical protein